LRKFIVSNFGTIERWKRQVKLLRAETYALYLAYRDPRVPWYSKAFAALVVGYAFSPIDLIPDFIPILGYLDDLILVPIGITIALKMIPNEVMVDARQKAEISIGKVDRVSRVGLIIVVCIWLLVALLLFLWVFRIIRK